MFELLKSDFPPEPGRFCYFDFSSSLSNFDAPNSHESFELITWNVNAAESFELQLAHLKEVSPDILCVQEMPWRRDSINMIELYALELGYPYVAYTTCYVDYSNHVLATVTFSKFPILKDESSILKLPDHYDWSSIYSIAARNHPLRGFRLVQKLPLQIGDRVVLLYNTHLENLATVSERFSDYLKILDDVERENAPGILVGDFNTADHGFAMFFNEEWLFMNAKELFAGLFGLHKTRAWRDPLRKELRTTQGFWKAIMEKEISIWKRELEKQSYLKTFIDPVEDPTFFLGFFYKSKLDHIQTEKGAFKRFDYPVGPVGLSDHLYRRARITIV